MPHVGLLQVCVGNAGALACLLGSGRAAMLCCGQICAWMGSGGRLHRGLFVFHLALLLLALVSEE